MFFYGYKHVYKYLNSFAYDSETKNLKFIKPKKYFPKFWSFHRDNIDKLKTIDGVIFIYSGHGSEGSISTQDDRSYLIPSIQEAFDNETLDILDGKLKLFLFDCCRGQ